ncbi:MAG: hypothetical protein KA383_11295 [Phycisphaerae bacterium]|nr:hypothetical protein [Phycisphaerae bacterium]
MAAQRTTSTGIWLGLGVALLVLPVAWAADNLYVPAAGGNWNVAANWSLGHCPNSTEHAKILVSGNAHKSVIYNWTDVSNYQGVTVDGSAAGYYGAIFQYSQVLTTTNLYLSLNGDAWYWMEGPPFLWVNEDLYVGYQGTHNAHFYMNTVNDPSAGLYVGDICYVGYSGPGDFDHTNGIAEVYRLYVGQNDPGTYILRNGRLQVNNQIVIGNGDAGTFEQRNGEFEQTGTNGIIMGLNTGGVGTYLMKGGELDIDHISLAWNGDAYFTQTGGTVTTLGDINIGCQGTHPYRTWYKLGNTDGASVLNVGDDLLVGVQTLGKYEQTGGTATIAGDLEIWKGTSTSDYSYVYLGTNAGLLDVNGEVINHSGYYDQDGGVMTTSHFTNDSTSGVNVDNNAEFRATALTHNAGNFTLWRNAIVRGELAYPPSTYWLCNFANNATFQMGSAAFNGGSFRGILTNNGTFNYYQGDFSGSSLLNYGTFNNYANFTCRRFVNYANFTLNSDRWITADGLGYANAVENNGTLTMYPSSHIDVGNSSKLVNNGPMYAGGPGATYAHVYGDMENHNYLLPCHSALPSGHLYVNGDFTAYAGAELRIRIHGTALDDFDRLSVQGTANLAGELDVRLTSGFVPNLGASFDVVGYSARVGQFNPVYLPALPSGRAWRVEYTANSVRLRVVEPSAVLVGDLNCDGNVGFGDINPFVLYLSNHSTWLLTYPDCPPENGDINGDGNYPSFGDINPFVTLLSSGG